MTATTNTVTQMDLLALYGYYTYSYDTGYCVADPSDAEDGFFLSAVSIEKAVGPSYEWLKNVVVLG